VSQHPPSLIAVVRTGGSFIDDQLQEKDKLMRTSR
jgi:hypothetical protein